MFRPFLAWCRKYLSIVNLLIIGVLVYMLFFQDNSASRIYGYDQTIDSLRTEIKTQTDTMEYYHDLNRRMDNRDPEIIERVVRENHNMNTVDEEVYIFD